MPAKKKAAAAAEPETPAKVEKVADTAPQTAEPGTTRTGVDILPADRAVLQEDIDTRMAALLKDHQEMGVRPE